MLLLSCCDPSLCFITDLKISENEALAILEVASQRAGLGRTSESRAVVSGMDVIVPSGDRSTKNIFLNGLCCLILQFM